MIPDWCISDVILAALVLGTVVALVISVISKIVNS